MVKRLRKPVKTGYVISLACGDARDAEMICMTKAIAQRELVRLNGKKISPNMKYIMKEIELVDE